MTLVISTEITETAFIALRAARDADGAAVVDEAVAELIAFLGRDNFPQFLLHLCGLLDVIHEADQVAEADAVRVRDDRGLAEDVAEDEIRTLSADAGEGEELLHGVRHLVMELFVEHAHAGGDIPRLAPSKAAGTDDGLDFLRRRCGEGGDRRVLLQKVNHHDIDSRIRALRGEAYADEQLPGIAVIECAVRLRIFVLQAGDDRQS